MKSAPESIPVTGAHKKNVKMKKRVIFIAVPEAVVRMINFSIRAENGRSY